MKAFKLILKILFVIVFIFSVIFNIQLFSSAHGTLILSHDDEKMLIMVNTEKNNFTPANFLTRKNVALQVYKENRTETSVSKIHYQVYMDEEAKLLLKAETTKQTFDTDKANPSFTKSITYYKNGQYFSENGSALSTSENTLILADVFLEVNTFQEILLNDIKETDNKAMIDFSISPFYFIGLRYTIKEETRNITIKYDLSGNIRKIIVEQQNGDVSTYEIGYDDEKVEFPFE